MKQEQKLYSKEKTVEPTTGKAFYQRQIAALEAHDMDALLTQYHPGATMIGFDITVEGHAAIRKHFEGYLERLGTLKLKSTEKFTETDDAIFFEATITSRLGEARVYDVFLLRDGKATHHFTGVISLQAG
jgi:SnoaL-like domain